MGVLANHVPSIEQLKPGLVEIIEEQGGSKQFFLSGGFATVQPNSVLSINAVEGYPLEDFSAEVRNISVEEKQLAKSLVGCQKPDRRGSEDCQWKRQRSRHCRGQD